MNEVREFWDGLKVIFKASWVYFAVAVVVWLGGNAIISRLFPRTPIEVSWVELWGIPFIALVPSAVAILVGFGIMFHGIAIIRR